MPFDNYSLAKKLVQSTALPRSGSRPRHVETRDGNASMPSPQPSLSANSAPVQPTRQSVAQSAQNPIRREESNADLQFLTWVNKLDNKVLTLQSRIPSGNLELLEKEANTCKAELQHLYDYAKQHNVSIEQCYNQLQSIKLRLDAIDLQLRQKQEQIEKNKRPLWMKIINVVVIAIEFVSALIGLAPLGGLIRNLLPGGNNPKLLK